MSAGTESTLPMLVQQAGCILVKNGITCTMRRPDGADWLDPETVYSYPVEIPTALEDRGYGIESFTASTNVVTWTIRIPAGGPNYPELATIHLSFAEQLASLALGITAPTSQSVPAEA